MEKISPRYLSEAAGVSVRRLYSGHNDEGLWDYAAGRKELTTLHGMRFLLGRLGLGLTELMLRVLDGVPNEVLRGVDVIVNSDAGKVGKFSSI